MKHKLASKGALIHATTVALIFWSHFYKIQQRFVH